MKTFSQIRTAFLEMLAQLKHLDGAGTITRAMFTVKEREVGKLCYQAEEVLPQGDLLLLKDMLNLRENTWKAYKQAYQEGLHP